jgi:hypothetical protein
MILVAATATLRLIHAAFIASIAPSLTRWQPSIDGWLSMQPRAFPIFLPFKEEQLATWRTSSVVALNGSDLRSMMNLGCPSPSWACMTWFCHGIIISVAVGWSLRVMEPFLAQEQPSDNRWPIGGPISFVNDCSIRR